MVEAAPLLELSTGGRQCCWVGWYVVSTWCYHKALMLETRRRVAHSATATATTTATIKERLPRVDRSWQTSFRYVQPSRCCVSGGLLCSCLLLLKRALAVRDFHLPRETHRNFFCQRRTTPSGLGDNCQRACPSRLPFWTKHASL